MAAEGEVAFEVYPKDPQYVRQRAPVVRVVEVLSTCRRGILGGYDHAATEMAERLVAVLNAPLPAYYPGRYVLDVEDDTGTAFVDTGELVTGKAGDAHVGEPVRYTLRDSGGATLSAEFDVLKLVGMLNYAEHRGLRLLGSRNG